MEEQIGDSKREENAFRRATIVQVTMEELTSQWQWKSRNVAMEEQIGDSKREENAFRRAKIVKVAMEELTSGNGRAEMWQWKSR